MGLDCTTVRSRVFWGLLYSPVPEKKTGPCRSPVQSFLETVIRSGPKIQDRTAYKSVRSGPASLSRTDYDGWCKLYQKVYDNLQDQNHYNMLCTGQQTFHTPKNLDRDQKQTRQIPVAQYADVGHESAPNRVRFGSGPVPGRHPVLGGGIGGLRQLGAEPAH